MEPERVLWQLASVHQRAARWEKAAAACDRLDLSTPFATNVLPQVGAIYERAGNEKKALEAYRKAVEQDRNPYLAVSNGLHAKLGRILEKAQDFEGAWRIYTKGIEAVARVREQYGETMIPRVARPTEETEVDPGKLRDAMMKRLGADYFVSKLLEKPPMPIEAGVRRRVRELYELLRSDSVAEREDAFAELRKIGPAAAPFVREGLKSTDSEFQARVRRLLVEWSEPR
jgi:tetratricopeptide (TPR) repeat protein